MPRQTSWQSEATQALGATSLWRFVVPGLARLVMPAVLVCGTAAPLDAKLALPEEPEDARACAEAFAYLWRSPMARGVLQRLTASKSEYRIVVGFPPFSLDEMAGGYAGRTIYWLPTDAMEWRTWTLGQTHRRSPALILLHELGHAYHEELNPVTKALSYSRRGRRWGNDEERRTIQQIENPAARELGEPERTWHNSSWPPHFRAFVSTGPASVIEHRDWSKFSPLRF